VKYLDVSTRETRQIMNKYTNKSLLPMMAEYKETGIMSDELGLAILTIAKNLSNKGNFRGYTWKEDMVSEGVCLCVRYLKNFDLNKSKNPFAYITQICWNAFLMYLRKEKQKSKVKAMVYDFHIEEKEKPPKDWPWEYQRVGSIDYRELKEK
jgi:DNA-directed RNA polymerase specialized sigma subunit